MENTQDLSQAMQFLATQRDGVIVPEMYGTEDQQTLEEIDDVQYFDLVTGNKDQAYRIVVDEYFMFHISGGMKLGFGIAKQKKGKLIFERRKVGERVLFAVGFEWIEEQSQYKMKQVALIDIELDLVNVSVEGKSMKG